MRRPRALSAWTAELASALPHLSGPQVKVLAEYSMAMVLAGRCGLSCTAFALSRWLGEKFDAARERLRDWYRGAADKSGAARGGKRRELDVDACFGPLLAWVLRDWQGPDLAVALDATTLGERFVVLEAAVLYRGGAIPVAWSVVPATAKGAWKPHWLALLRSFKDTLDGVPAPAPAPAPARGLRVIVLADRGLYARWLFREVVALGWHPLLRINAYNADFRPCDGGEYLPVASLAAGPGTSYAAAGVIFRNPDKRQACTLLARRDEGYRDAWHVVTDLPPSEADAAWYGLRAWVERGFRHTKGGGLHWDDTRMTDPARAGRLWLAMAVASVLLLRQGGRLEPDPEQDPQPEQDAEPQPQREPVDAAVDGAPAPAAPSPHRPRRILSIFCTGMLLVRTAALAGTPAPHDRFVPEPWPRTPAAAHPASARPP